MNKRLLIFIITPLLLIFMSCETAPPSIDSILLFDGVSFDPANDTLDFGTRLAGGSGSSISGTVRNQSDTPITVQSLALNDAENYELSEINLPQELASGATLEFTLSFSPLSTGTKAAELSITYTFETEQTVTAALTGEGNEAPSAVFGVEVSGAVDYPEVNGFYLKDGTYNSAVRYKKSGTPSYYIYYFMSDGDWWGINDTMNEDYPYYSGGRYGARVILQVSALEHLMYVPEYNLSDGNDWAENSLAAGTVTVKTGISRNGSVLNSQHSYTDTEGDAESGTRYRWFKSSTIDGTYTVIAGATGSEISASGDEGNFFKLEVTPVDTNGFEGDPVLSDPYYVETIPQ